VGRDLPSGGDRQAAPFSPPRTHPAAIAGEEPPPGGSAPRLCSTGSPSNQAVRRRSHLTRRKRRNKGSAVASNS
jgi:hypothetical protein